MVRKQNEPRLAGVLKKLDLLRSMVYLGFEADADGYQSTSQLLRDPGKVFGYGDLDALMLGTGKLKPWEVLRQEVGRDLGKLSELHQRRVAPWWKRAVDDQLKELMEDIENYTEVRAKCTGFCAFAVKFGLK